LDAAHEQNRGHAGPGLMRVRSAAANVRAVGFIDSFRDRLGVEPVCAVLEIPASTYCAAKKR